MTRHPAIPEGEDLRKAVHWLGEHGEHTLEAVEDACRKFDLSPADEEFLMRHFLQKEKPENYEVGELKIEVQHAGEVKCCDGKAL